MTLFRTIVFAAALTGLVAGLAMTLMQSFATVPLILEAEAYEQAAPTHAHAPGTGAHDHGDAFAPADGIERTAFTAAANILTAIGFALVLTAASELAGGITSWRQGLLWGLSGFAVFTLAPAIGLPPELPAMPAADLGARQLWWVATAAATALGLAAIVFGRTPAFVLFGLVCLVVPHLLGAPQPPSDASPIPDALHRRFIVATVTSSLIFWMLLGSLAGFVRSRLLAARA